MKKTLTINSYFCFSPSINKCFFTEFGQNINIIHGANTSGKSTLIQSLLYTFGINDVSKYFEDIYPDDTIFRLDCQVIDNKIVTPLIIVRNSGHIYIKYGAKPVVSFLGIDGNNSVEHISLKEYYHTLFDFNLQLLSSSSGKYSSAPIETLFLPYYVAQSVGWVSIRKSFENLDYYKNFKEDYLDYYLGVDSNNNMERKYKLQTSIKELEATKSTLSEFIKSDVDFTISTLEDESLKAKAEEYFEQYKKKEEELIACESKYVLCCNKLSYYQTRKSILAKVKINTNKQDPSHNGTCPICNQLLILDIASKYKFDQQKNDTESEIQKINTQINRVASEINTLKKYIKALSVDIEKHYSIIKEHQEADLNFDRWVKNKANVQMIDDIEIRKKDLNEKIDTLKEELKEFKSYDELIDIRKAKTYNFKRLFEQYLAFLRVKELTEDRFLNLYRIAFFTRQGVELHKIILAYLFAFNNIISKSANIHRLPFMLDAIFKEDIDSSNKKLMLEFISQNRPLDTQLLISIADKEEDIDYNGATINKYYFGDNANLIHIGNSERSFWRDWDESYSQLTDMTYQLISL